MLQVKIEFDPECKLAAYVIDGDGWASHSRADGYVVIEHPDKGNVIVTSTTGKESLVAGTGRFISWMTLTYQPMNQRPQMFEGTLTPEQSAGAMSSMEFLTAWVNARLVEIDAKAADRNAASSLSREVRL